MLLAMDVGNTNVTFGVFRGRSLLGHWRLGTVAARSSDEYAVMMEAMLRRKNMALEQITEAAVACVVPQLEWVVVHMIEQYCGTSPLVVGPGIKTGLRIALDNPREVGADRIVNVVAALEEKPPPLVLVDFGTATTFDCVDETKAYIGGAIAPGLNISMEALFKAASKLPRVRFARPESPIGRDTITSLQSGLFHGYVSMVDGILDKLLGQLGRNASVLATGGLGKLIAPESRYIEKVDNLLTLKGLEALHRRNRQQRGQPDA